MIPNRVIFRILLQQLRGLLEEFGGEFPRINLSAIISPSNNCNNGAKTYLYVNLVHQSFVLVDLL